MAILGQRRAKRTWVAFGRRNRFHLVRYFGANVLDALSRNGPFSGVTACRRHLTSWGLVEGGDKPPRGRACSRCIAAQKAGGR